jgi:hypothetical protein
MLAMWLAGYRVWFALAGGLAIGALAMGLIGGLWR